MENQRYLSLGLLKKLTKSSGTSIALVNNIVILYNKLNVGQTSALYFLASGIEKSPSSPQKLLPPPLPPNFFLGKLTNLGMELSL